jgi:cobalamin biosynthesis protein CobT
MSAGGDEEGEGQSGLGNRTGDNSGAAGSTKGRKQEVEAYTETTEMCKDDPGYDYSGVTGTGGGSKKVIKSKENHKTITPEQAIEEAVSEAEGLAEKEMQKKPEKVSPTTQKSSTMTQEEVSRMCTDVGYDEEDIRTYREERCKYRMIPLSDSLRPAAVKFRRKVERCFKEKNMEITKMSSGKLDTRQLYRLGMKEYNVFRKQANRSLADAVVEVCWDGSGSMCGGKQKLSADACAIIEEGLKGVVPLKIINFTTDWSHREVVHYLVKDFDENDRGTNYTLSYSHSKNFNGGNKDGYDIRVCTEDLMKRKEKDKILIVMSDGLPSDYDSINPQDDVKDAVKCARKKGIIVIPIFFGDDYFRERALKDYEYMYEKNIINSAPEELPVRLVKLFEALVLK